ncbi:MAG: rhamnulose-1-phosphate aldolase [Candidatus Cloacimonadales bacterium]|jgi:rhamnulose-1-phosphate aldolase|nr:rhamnulose-1-phosphate aldolase [Candidatus Cloacimonadota bacterium]MDD2651235.1 rhamnulose-1-phosphate aldolase [Candidatus Cloacimonadota bacterium]MDD3501507.1 rhamnulose-1-phosphate aldolase [Candidatus Cloacimonadota bacterium]MDX9976458.1 rhamnulose-1-phosphate aldolase [Candidatus Cloacimonadales bacterium]
MKFNDIIEITKLMYEKGWAERNAGNFSIRLTATEKNMLENDFQNVEELCIDNRQNILRHDINLLISVSGSRFRTIHTNLINNIGILSINFSKQKAMWYHNGHIPTSEWMSHLRIHNKFLDINSTNKCIIHTHPTELIAFSHKLNDKNEDYINTVLANMMPEVSLFIPKGIGLVSDFAMGSEDLAKASEEKIVNYDILLWQKHGCLATGKNFWELFESIELVNKAAKIYLLCGF